jgi:hypothetical protein
VVKVAAVMVLVVIVKHLVVQMELAVEEDLLAVLLHQELPMKAATAVKASS